MRKKCVRLGQQKMCFGGQSNDSAEMETTMINFNVPPYTGKEIEYIKQAVENQKICGDGPFTKKCNEWIEKKTGTAKCLLTPSCTQAYGWFYRGIAQCSTGSKQ